MADQDIYIPSGDLDSGGTGAVDSVNGQTGVVVLATDNVSDTAQTNKYVTAAEKTKLSNLSGTNTGDQTTVTGNAGTATALQTARNIDGVSFNGTADITVIAPGTHAATSKATPVDADELPLVDSAASNVLKKLTWANLKATMAAYYDSLSTILTNKTISGASNTLSNIGNGSLSNSSVTVGSTSISLGATATTLAGVTLTTPTIASFANANHNHQNSAGGGTLANAALTNSSVTIGSTSVSLGATATTLAGVTLTTPTIASFANAGHDHSNSAGGGQLTSTSALNATGTPSSSTFLRGDNTWSTPAGGGDVSSNTATSVDSEIALFNSTTGKSIKRATGTGVAHLTSGVLSASGVVNSDLSTSAGELGAAWATYTPTWTNVSIGNATVGLRYKQIGKTVFVRGTVIYGNSTSVSGTIIFSLPVTSASYAGTTGTQPIGSGIIYDVSGGGVFRSAVIWNSTTTARLNVLPANGTWVSYFNADATNPVAPGTSDEWTVSFCYEAA